VSLCANTLYQYGDRSPETRAAATLIRKQHRVTVARHGPRMVDAAVTRRQLQALHRRWSWYQLERMLPHRRGALAAISRGDIRKVRVSTAAAVDALWLDVCGPQPADPPRWPTQPLRQAIERRYGALNRLENTNLRRNLYKTTLLTSATADRYAIQLGWLPHEIWPDWLEEVA
jgi:hypothetical protein